MKVVMVTSSAFPFHNSGVAYVVHNTTKELIQMGHEVFVLGLDLDATPSKAETTDMSYDGYKVRGLRLPRDKYAYTNPLADQILEQTLKEINPDIVHFHSLEDLGAGTIKKAKEMGYKTVVTMHDWWWMCPFSFLANNHHEPCNQLQIDETVCSACIQISDIPHTEDYITNRSAYLKQILKDDTDLIIPVSDYVKSYLEPNGITNKNIITIPNGVEPYNKQGHRPTKPTTKLTSNPVTNPTANPTIRFGFLGGKHQLKGYDLLIEACQDLDATNYEVHVYGTLQLNTGLAKKVLKYLKGGNIKELISKIKRHLPKNSAKNMPITYHPLFKPEEKDRVYREFDILLSLSNVKESSSLVVREALIRGIPVITTPSGGPEEVIINGKNGIILKESSPKQLKDAMEQILRTNSLKNMEEYIQKNPYTYTTTDQTIELIKQYENLL